MSYVYAVNETSLVDLDGDASLTLEGTSNRIQLRLIGNSKYKGETMEVGTVKATMEDDPTAHIYAHGDFELSAKGRSRFIFTAHLKSRFWNFWIPPN